MFVKRYQKSILERMTGLYLSESLDNCDLTIFKCFISTTSTNKKYYKALGISPSATQSDIKAAYYRLSKLYHPDRNKGSGKAAEKFRDISEAYEVLGNYKKRKLYDKGIIHTVNPEYAGAQEYYDEKPKEEDSAQTKFYKAHMKKSQVPNSEGRTPIYNFDEWSRVHYGKSFERRKAAKERFDKAEAKKADNNLATKNELLLFCIVICVFAFSLIILGERSLDENKIMQKSKKIDES